MLKGLFKKKEKIKIMNNKMAINTYISTTESEKQTKQNKYRGRSTEAEHFDDC